MVDLLTRLLPFLSNHAEEPFNVFNVMHHGTHEKQLSNVFAWLLNAEQTHRLGDTFQRIFIDETNQQLGDFERIPYGAYSVRQEQNTSASGEGMDIADLVLEDHETTIVIENYYTSSGHRHGYERYKKFGSQNGKRSVVVMLCETENRSLLVDGWEHAPVATYANLLTALSKHVEDDRYKSDYPQQYAFVEQMYRRFVKERRMSDDHLLDFIEVLCETGEAGRFGKQDSADAAIRFADQVREDALNRFNDSRVLLGRAKQSLRSYGRSVLMPRINAAVGDDYVTDVAIDYSGINQWTINFYGPEESGQKPRRAQLKFGPSAWTANEVDTKWKVTVPAANTDYSRLFVTCGLEIRQSAVSIGEVLAGLPADDTRLSDELIELISSKRSSGDDTADES